MPILLRYLTERFYNITPLIKLGNLFGNLRKKCFIIGYMHLISIVIDMVGHLWIVAAITNGFECDVASYTLNAVNWNIILPILFIINLGTNGFYPYPIFYFGVYVDAYATNEERHCYHGMVHISMFDIVSFVVNIIWFRYITLYVKALHKADYKPMALFSCLSAIKICLQVALLAYQPFTTRLYDSVELYWITRVTDIVVSALFLTLIYAYMVQVKLNTDEIKAPFSIESNVNQYGTKEEIATFSENISLVIDKDDTIFPAKYIDSKH